MSSAELHAEGAQHASLRVEEIGPIRLVADAPEAVALSAGGEMYDVSAPDYEGAYEARALFEGQVFPTADRKMLRDFTVGAINYTEAPNDYGTTVTIGG